MLLLFRVAALAAMVLLALTQAVRGRESSRIAASATPLSVANGD